MKKIKFPLGIIALLIAVSAAFAFNVPAKKNGKIPIRYHYTSGSGLLVDMQNIANWKAEDPNCGEFGSKPCAIDFDGTLAQLDVQLDTYTTPGQVEAAAIEKKN